MLQRSPNTARAARDLAISAVASDAALVSELIADISARLTTPLSWQATSEPEPGDELVPFAPTTSRVVLVLYSHLWLHDEAAQHDVPLFRERIDESPDSVCVLSLDGTPLPAWLQSAPRYDLMRNGREQATTFVLDAVSKAGGTVGTAAVDSPNDAPQRWGDAPIPFLSQQRAQSTLRHELDALVVALTRAVDEARAAQPDRPFEMQITPQRIVARLDDVAVSFSWISGRSGSVAEGNLLVIGWRGVTAGLRGVAALRSAAVIHERSYAAAGDAPGTWRWRTADTVSQPYSTANLAGEWMARASIARAG